MVWCLLADQRAALEGAPLGPLRRAGPEARVAALEPREDLLGLLGDGHLLAHVGELAGLGHGEADLQVGVVLSGLLLLLRGRRRDSGLLIGKLLHSHRHAHGRACSLNDARRDARRCWRKRGLKESL